MIAVAASALQEAGCTADSLVKLVLTGSLDVACEKDIAYLQSRFAGSFYFVKVYDETALKINIEDYLLDESLKGEYVRQVMKDAALSDEEKAQIIRYGLQALAGEEIE